MKVSSCILTNFGVLLLSACSYPGAIYVEDVQVGLDVSVSTTDTRPLNINLGYDRSLFVVAPKHGKGKDAVSLLSKSDILIQFTEESKIQTIFVSGKAAKSIAEQEDRMEALFKTVP